MEEEQLAFLGENPLYTTRFALFVGRRCHSSTVNATAELHLDWHTLSASFASSHPNIPRRSTFIDVEGVEPTNNFGERCIRHAVMYRKTSFGTQSDTGSRFVERAMTAFTTLKL